MCFKLRFYDTYEMDVDEAFVNEKAQENPPCPEAKSEASKKPHKKNVRKEICKQMEFYFSDSNLSKDRFIKHEISKSHLDGCNLNLENM